MTLKDIAGFRGEIDRGPFDPKRGIHMSTIEELHQNLIRMLDSIGKYKTETKKDSIHIFRERAFVGIHPKKSYLGVNFVLNRADATPPASKVEKVSANRFHHYYKITGKLGLSRSFARLLKEAYDLAEPQQ